MGHSSALLGTEQEKGEDILSGTKEVLSIHEFPPDRIRQNSHRYELRMSPPLSIP
jgi:hypothetical protein